ncbi:MAG: hypothetical protein AB1393_14495, partial [Candidatus Edwardsbacteria bacterium]
LNEAEIYFSRYTAGGWTAPFLLGIFPIEYTPDIPGSGSISPSLAVGKSDTAFISWKTAMSDYLPIPHYAVVWAGWFNIAAPSLNLATLDSVTTLPYPCPCVAVDTSGVSHFAWDDKPPRYYSISYRKRDKSGFSIEEEISQGPENSSPYLDFSRWQNRIDAIWEGPFLGMVSYRSKLDTATIWDSIAVVDTSAIWPVITAGGYAVFTKDSEIYKKRKIGNLWPDTTLQNISNTPTTSNFPQACFSQTVSGSNLFTVWTEGNSAPYEIRFAKLSVPPVAKFYVDAGQIEKSPYCIQREGYKIFGPEAYKTIDYHPEKLIYLFGGFEKNKKYEVEVVYYYEKETPVPLGWVAQASSLCRQARCLSHQDEGQVCFVMEMDIDGTLKARTKIKSDERVVVKKPIPNSAYNKDGEVYLYINRIKGDYALVAEIYIYEFDKKPETEGKGATQLAVQSSKFIVHSKLYQSYPNPFRQATEIKYQIAECG